MRVTGSSGYLLRVLARITRASTGLAPTGYEIEKPIKNSCLATKAAYCTKLQLHQL